MSTLYLRNVPDETRAQLQRLAARAGMSVSAYAVRELIEAARRADNPALVADLTSFAVSPATIVADLEAGRSGR